MSAASYLDRHLAREEANDHFNDWCQDTGRDPDTAEAQVDYDEIHDR